jgi:hypothetical protein
VNETGRYLDGSALRRRYRAAQTAAKVRPIRFHDLRHTFGSLAVRQVGAFDVQAYMGHADGRTTARYTHYRSRSGEAERLAPAFTIQQPETAERVEALPERKARDRDRNRVRRLRRKAERQGLRLEAEFWPSYYFTLYDAAGEKIAAVRTLDEIEAYLTSSQEPVEEEA